MWTEVFSKSTAVVSGERLTPLWTLNAAKGDRWRQAGWDRGVGGEESETSFYPQCLLLEHVPKPVYRPSQLDWAWRHWYPRYWCGQTQPPAMFVQRRPSCLLAGRSEWVGELAVKGPELPNRKQWRKWWMKRRFTGWYPNDCRLYAFIWRAVHFLPHRADYGSLLKTPHPRTHTSHPALWPSSALPLDDISWFTPR